MIISHKSWDASSLRRSLKGVNIIPVLATPTQFGPQTSRSDRSLRVAPLARAWRWIGLGAALTLAALAATLPPDALPQLSWANGAPISDKALHLVGFAGLGLVFGVLFRRWLLGFVGLVVFGLLLEAAQALSGLGREADLQDGLANAVGLGVALVMIVACRSVWSMGLAAFRLVMSAGRTRTSFRSLL